MLLLDWLTVWTDRFATATRYRRPSRRVRSTGIARTVQVESLETRALLAVFHVTADVADGNAGSLRAAITQANRNGQNDEIILAPGVYHLTRIGRNENANVTGDLDITEARRSLTIRGAGQMRSIIDAAGIDRVFEVKAGAKLELSGVSIAHGDSEPVTNFHIPSEDETNSFPIGSFGPGGGGVFNAGELIVTQCDFISNHAFVGGAISNHGTATITSTNFFANSAEQWGGAVLNQESLAVSRSLFSGNLCSRGGAIDQNQIFVTPSGFMEMTVDQSTMLLNAAVSPLVVNLAKSATGISADTITQEILVVLNGDEIDFSGLTDPVQELLDGLPIADFDPPILDDLSAIEDLAVFLETLTSLDGSPLPDSNFIGVGMFESLFGPWLSPIVETALADFALPELLPFPFVTSPADDPRGPTFAEQLPYVVETFLGALTPVVLVALSESRQLDIRDLPDIPSIPLGIGGGGQIGGGTAVITNSTFTLNVASNGGGLSVGHAVVALSDSTLSTNFASHAGGGLHSTNGVIYSISSTITNNVADIGGGIHQDRIIGPVLFDPDVGYEFPTIIVQNSIIARNQAEQSPDVSDVSGGNSHGNVFLSLGHNLIGVGDPTIRNLMSSDLLGTSAEPLDPLLGALDDYGGPTPTHVLRRGSPALDTGDSSWLPEVVLQGRPNESVVDIDQRGMERAQDGDGDGIPRADIGAFEAVPLTVEIGEPGEIVFSFENGELLLSRSTEDGPDVQPVDVSGPLSAINGSDGDDHVVLDLSNGDFLPEFLTIDLGGQSAGGGDSLEIRGGEELFDFVVYVFTTPQEWYLSFGGHTLTIRGVESITDLLSSDEHHFNFSDAADQLTLSGSDLPDSISPLLQIASAGTAPAVTFAMPTWAISISTQGGNDRVRIADSVPGTGVWIQVEGGAGNDSLQGGLSSEGLSGSEGNDTLLGGSGNDLLSGGSGNDKLFGQDGDDCFFADLGNDVIDGGQNWDYLFAGGDANFTLTNSTLSDGNREISGYDQFVELELVVISGGASANRLDARNFRGRVSLFGAGGNDTLLGGRNDDRLYGGDGKDLLKGGGGQDDLNGENGNDTLEGGDGDDWLSGNAGHDVVLGGKGNDSTDGGEGNDTVTGDIGDDWLAGSGGNDSILAGAGHDSCDGGDGSDTLKGEAGNDTLNGGSGRDKILGGDHDDVIAGGDGNDTINGDNGTDVLIGQAGNDRLMGDKGNDTLSGGDDNDTLQGGADTDVLMGDGGDNQLDGGNGTDIILVGTGHDRVVDKADINLAFAPLDLSEFFDLFDETNET